VGSSYFAFTESDLSTIDREDAVFKTILEELSMIKDAIELKETELKDRK
jgi:hypothetical protein